MRRFELIALSMVMVFVASCAKKPARVDRGEIGKPSVASEKLMERLRLFEEGTKAVKAMAKLTIIDGDMRRHTDAAIVIARPDSIRIDAMDSLTDVWAQAGSDGENLWLYLPSKKKLYKGRSIRRNLRHLLKFDVDVSEWISMMTGTPPLKGGAELSQLGKAGDNHFAAYDGGLHVWTKGRDAAVYKCARYGDSGEGIVYVANFSDYRPVGKLAFPYMVEVSFPERNAKVVVEYEDVAMGGGIDPGIFRPPHRQGENITDLDSVSDDRR